MATVRTGLAAATKPTCRMSRNRIHRRRKAASLRCNPLRPEVNRRPRTRVATAMAIKAPHATPALPRRGNGPQPRLKAPLSGTCIAAVSNMVSAGDFMSPVPRNRLLNVLNNQTIKQPAKTMSE